MALVDKTCVEVQCDECGYFFDEDNEGRQHFDVNGDAIAELTRYGWQLIADTLYCDGDDCKDAAAKAKRDKLPDEIPGQLDIVEDGA